MYIYILKTDETYDVLPHTQTRARTWVFWADNQTEGQGAQSAESGRGQENYELMLF